MDPGMRLLPDLKQLITEKRVVSFYPILMMDAHDDELNSTAKTFQSFLEWVQLIDHLHKKFKDEGLTTSIYSRGSRRIDYIFVDATMEPVIKRLGSLGLHEGIVSDHTMLYIDCNEELLFKGVLDRPVLNPAQEFVLV